MTTIETKQWFRDDIDRSAWGSGPWDNEPDKKQWQDAATGMACLALRNSFGAWCGYVGVPPSHRLHGHPYRDVDTYIDVHGGLTFAAACAPDPDPSKGICHEAATEVWWFGFDCLHCGDRAPDPACGFYGDYCTIGYVEAECADLAAQLARLA